MNDTEMAADLQGLSKVYDYSQYAHDNNVNVIPEASFKRLVSDTFKTITDTLRATYGPYGSQVVISDQSETTTTKDGYNVFEALGFSHTYKRMVYLAIQKIIERVNRNVGDGTTSCILLAEKIFNNLDAIISTPDDKRLLLDCLGTIEKDLQDEDIINEDIRTEKICKLTKDSLKTLISVASNNDETLTNVIFEALSPAVDEKGYVTCIRNIVPDNEVVLDKDSNATYEIDFLPGDYRVRVNPMIDDLPIMENETKMKVVIYDHGFNSTDWVHFKAKYNNEPTIILARTFIGQFLENDWFEYVKDCEIKKKMHREGGEINIHLLPVQSPNVQAELKDLAAILGTEVRGIHAGDVNHDTIPEVTFSIYKGSCLSFYNLNTDENKTRIEKYIEELEFEMNNGDNKSYIRMKDYRDRISALRMDMQDTRLVVKCGTTLEAKLITDKIDDCISIANSAISSGIVPNILRYAYDRIRRINEMNETGSDMDKISTEIMRSIKGLFEDIWKSKFGTKLVDEKTGKSLSDFINDHYESSEYTAFDIVTCENYDCKKYPTSAQYDLEVVVAAISIVKYLLTGRAFIFDAHILPSVNDNGHYA